MPTLGTLSSFDIGTFDGSTSGEWAQSVGVDLGASAADALIVTAQVTNSSVHTSTNTYVDVYLALGATGTDTELSGGASGADAVYSFDDTSDQWKALRFLGRIATDSGASVKHRATFTVPGPLPRYIALVADNELGIPAADTAEDNFFKYQTIDY